MARDSRVYIIASDQSRNGKTMLARILADYLLLDDQDPLLIDTDAPLGPLRQFFPGRTALAEFEKTQGRMLAFDTVLAQPGRDYIIDLPQRHMQDFFKTADELEFFAAAKNLGFQIIVFFIVDANPASLTSAQLVYRVSGIDRFVAVTNDFVGSSWPREEGALQIPLLRLDVAQAIAAKRFYLREFVLGDDQYLLADQRLALNSFLFKVLDGLNTLDREISYF